MYIFLVKAHDRMFPGKPDVYFYGLFYSRNKRRNVARFGPDAIDALTISGASRDWTKFVAQGIAKLYSRGIDTYVVEVTPKVMREPCLLTQQTKRF